MKVINNFKVLGIVSILILSLGFIAGCSSKNKVSNTIQQSEETKGYENIDDYLYKNYPSGELSNNGSTYLYKHGDEKVFENNVELNYINHVQNLQDNAEKVIEENKGMVR